MNEDEDLPQAPTIYTPPVCTKKVGARSVLSVRVCVCSRAASRFVQSLVTRLVHVFFEIAKSTEGNLLTFHHCNTLQEAILDVLDAPPWEGPMAAKKASSPSQAEKVSFSEAQTCIWMCMCPCVPAKC